MTIPAAATSGAIVVTTAGGSATSASFQVLPTVTSFTPASGVVGTSVTINGSGFFGTPTVSFDGTAAASVTVLSATSLKATVPPGAGTGTIGVTDPDGGSATSATSFLVTPAITSTNPALGSAPPPGPR